MTTLQALELHKQFVHILKKRFNNLGAEELSDLAGYLVAATVSILKEGNA